MFSTDLSWAEGPAEKVGQHRDRKAREREGSLASSSSTVSRASSQTRHSFSFSSSSSSRPKNRKPHASTSRPTAAPPESEPVGLNPFGFVSAPGKSLRSLKSSHRPVTTATAATIATTATTASLATAVSNATATSSSSDRPPSPDSVSELTAVDSAPPASRSGSLSGPSSKRHHHIHPNFSAAWGSIRISRPWKNRLRAGSTDCGKPDQSFLDSELDRSGLISDSILSPTIATSISAEPDPIDRSGDEPDARPHSLPIETNLVELCQSYERIRRAVYALQVRNIGIPAEYFRLNPPNTLSDISSSGTGSLSSSAGDVLLHPPGSAGSESKAYADGGVEAPMSAPVRILSSFLVSAGVSVASSEVIHQLSSSATSWTDIDPGFQSNIRSRLANSLALQLKCFEQFIHPVTFASSNVDHPDSPGYKVLNDHPRSLQLCDSLAEIFYTATVFDPASIHWLVLDNPSPKPGLADPTSLPTPVFQVPSPTVLPLPFDSATFDLIRCSTLLSTLPASSIPTCISECHRVLSPSGVLHLRIVEPMPVQGTAGPRLQAWLEDNLEMKLEENFCCRRPRMMVPTWAVQAGFTIISSSSSSGVGSGSSSRLLRLPAAAPPSDDDDDDDGGCVPGTPFESAQSTRIAAAVLQQLWKASWADTIVFPNSGQSRDRDRSSVEESTPRSPPMVPISPRCPAAASTFADDHQRLQARSEPRSPSPSRRDGSGNSNGNGNGTSDPIVFKHPFSPPPSPTPSGWWLDRSILDECVARATVWDVTDLWLIRN